MHAAGDGELLAATVMPDHVHLLFVLGSRLTLGQVMAKFKSLVRNLGRGVDWEWQADGFEHQLRLGEPIEDYGFYIFMNPYRAKLVGPNSPGPLWWCPVPEKFLFWAHVKEGAPVPQGWIEKSVQLRGKLFVR